MNLFAFNSATLNGVNGVPLTAGKATLAAGCGISVTDTLNHAAKATLSANAVLAVNTAVRVVAGANAQVSASCEVTLAIRHIQAAGSSVQAGVQVSAYVLRNIAGAASVQVHAAMVAIPASTLAQVALSGTANLTAQARRIQRASANLSTSADAIASGVVRRMVSLQALAAASLRVEASRRHAGVTMHDGFADIQSAAALAVQDVGVVMRLASVEIQAQASCSAQALKIQSGNASLLVVAALDGQALILKHVLAQDGPGMLVRADVICQAIRTQAGSASVQTATVTRAQARQTMLASALLETNATHAISPASATRWQYPRAECLVISSVAAEASRIQLADVNLSVSVTLHVDAGVNVASTGHFTLGTADITASPLVARMAASHLLAGSTLLAQAAVIRQSGAILVGSAMLSASANMRRAGFATIATSMQVNAVADLTRRVKATILVSTEVQASAQAYSVLQMAEAGLSGQAETLADACSMRMAQVAIACSSDMTAIASASEHYYGIATILADCALVANAATNSAAFDPPERTMLRPFTEREMLRPFVNREMQRYA